MRVRYGDGKTEYGHRVHISGPRTTKVNGSLCKTGRIYVDPSGFVINQEGERLSGRGKEPEKEEEEEDEDEDEMGVQYNDGRSQSWNPIPPFLLFIVAPILIVVTLRGCT